LRWVEQADRQNPAQLAQFDKSIQAYTVRLEASKCVLLALQGVLLDEQSQQRSMQLMRYVIAWLMRLVQPGIEYPKTQITLPLAADQPMVFRCLPEYLLEDIVDNFKFITRNMPQALPVTQCEEIVTTCVAFLYSSDYVKNPHLKSGLVSILYHGIWPIRGREKGILGDLLNGSDFCHKFLLHAVMNFFIEAEATGAHTQFYDKFNIRYEIFKVIRCIWANPIYRRNLDIESKVNPEFFIRFVNLLLNDVTFVLGESFTSFIKIRNLQKELKNETSELDEAALTEKKRALEKEQGAAKSYMQLTNETVAMLKNFTEALAEAFTMPEVVQRLADMLGYNLALMVGPKQGELKVEDKKSYNFDPGELLEGLVDVYLNLRGQPSFALAVARDGRSYDPAKLAHAEEILRQARGTAPEKREEWLRFVAVVAEAHAADARDEEDLGEIPDEFLDPLLYTLMEDPVILPNSRQTIDRSTIRSHLLSDPHDPFNRMPLSIEDVVPNTELKQRIAEFKLNAKRKRDDAMDTS
jgi:ubiquitin conjugation factor E4 B